jgi:hypothetical protein
MCGNGLHNRTWFGSRCAHGNCFFSSIDEDAEDEIYERYFVGDVFSVLCWCSSVVCLWDLNQRLACYYCESLDLHPGAYHPDAQAEVQVKRAFIRSFVID